MDHQEERIAAYQKWVSAAKVFEREMESALKEEPYDRDLLRKRADELQEYFEEYCRAWELR